MNPYLDEYNYSYVTNKCIAFIVVLMKTKIDGNSSYKLTGVCPSKIQFSLLLSSLRFGPAYDNILSYCNGCNQ
jgi:hypothetical protein